MGEYNRYRNIASTITSPARSRPFPPPPRRHSTSVRITPPPRTHQYCFQPLPFSFISGRFPHGQIPAVRRHSAPAVPSILRLPARPPISPCIRDIQVATLGVMAAWVPGRVSSGYRSWRQFTALPWPSRVAPGLSKERPPPSTDGAMQPTAAIARSSMPILGASANAKEVAATGLRPNGTNAPAGRGSFDGDAGDVGHGQRKSDRLGVEATRKMSSDGFPLPG